MTRLFYTILYSAIAALVIAQWKRHDAGELLDLVGAGRANAQSPDPSLPGAYDPAANGGMNNPNGFNNFNPANPATQMFNSNMQQTPTTDIIGKDGQRPTAWPSKQAVYWGKPPAQPARPVPGADGLPGVSLTQYQETVDPSKPAAAPFDPNRPIGLQYPNPIQPYPSTAPPPAYPTTANYSAPAVPPASYPIRGTPAGYPSTAIAPAGNVPVNYPLPANPPPASPPLANPPPGAPPRSPPPQNASTGSAPPAEDPAEAPIDYGQRLPGTRIIGRVGTEFILESDVLGYANDMINRNKERIPKNQVDKVREELMKQRLSQLIETKVILSDCRASVPAEGFKKFAEKIGQHFDEEEVPKAMEKEGCKSRFELDEKMRANGGSLEREKLAYTERQMAMGWMHEKAKSDKEVTHEQMLEYYYQHLKEYEYQSKVRWEQLQVRFKNMPVKANAAAMAPLEWDPKTGQMRLKTDPSKAAAWRTIAEAGNRIVRGEPFADVAKSVSDGPTASKGGMHDWTTQGSLSAEEVDRYLFAAPIGQLSPIIEDERGFQIVRVVERKMAGRTPFTEVQPEIKKAIKDERTVEAVKKYLSSLQHRVSVWTVYEGRPMEELEPVRAKEDNTPVKDPSTPAGDQAPWLKAGKPAYP